MFSKHRLLTLAFNISGSEYFFNPQLPLRATQLITLMSHKIELFFFNQLASIYLLINNTY